MSELEFVEPMVELISIKCEDIVFRSGVGGGASGTMCAEGGDHNDAIDECVDTTNQYVMCDMISTQACGDSVDWI